MELERPHICKELYYSIQPGKEKNRTTDNIFPLVCLPSLSQSRKPQMQNSGVTSSPTYLSWICLWRFVPKGFSLSNILEPVSIPRHAFAIHFKHPSPFTENMSCILSSSELCFSSQIFCMIWSKPSLESFSSVKGEKHSHEKIISSKNIHGNSPAHKITPVKKDERQECRRPF